MIEQTPFSFPEPEKTLRTYAIALDQIHSKARGPLIQLFDRLLLKAVQANASRLELTRWQAEGLVISVDGRDAASEPLPLKLAGSIVARAKVIANLDLTVNDEPQFANVVLQIPDRTPILLGITTRPTEIGEELILEFKRLD